MAVVDFLVSLYSSSLVILSKSPKVSKLHWWILAPIGALANVWLLYMFYKDLKSMREYFVLISAYMKIF